DGGQIDWRQRKPAAGRDLAGDGPVLKQRAAPTIEQGRSVQAHARAVLQLQIQQVALVETGESAFAAQVEPVLGDHGWSLPVSALRTVVDRLRECVLRTRGEPAVQTAA